ncbi:MAG TPA: lytic transglycosylase domain-containing protein [Gemmatimonadaceae bacterium]|nr:lytic transglycosylase domain-containing protein [Gemmatimonadaceae bacterium]
MRNLRGTYVHRGDAERRRTRVKRAALLLTCCGALGMAWDARTGPAEASAETAVLPRGAELNNMRDEINAARGEIDLAHAQLERWNRIYNYSTKYRIGADLAASIYDVAMQEKIEPELAFRLVRVESEFNEHATSPVGAVGLTQVMPATAKYFQKDVTKEKLYDRHLNLRIGFRYLRGLIREYKGDVKLALLVYNRGPQAVETLRTLGVNPSNGYEHAVMREYNGKGTID